MIHTINIIMINLALMKYSRDECSLASGDHMETRYPIAFEHRIKTDSFKQPMGLSVSIFFHFNYYFKPMFVLYLFIFFLLQLKINAVRILCSIVKSTNSTISHQFIHGCIPSIVAKIENLTTVNSELELNFCNESFALLETLVAMAPENSR